MEQRGEGVFIVRIEGLRQKGDVRGAARQKGSGARYKGRL